MNIIFKFFVSLPSEGSMIKGRMIIKVKVKVSPTTDRRDGPRGTG